MSNTVPLNVLTLGTASAYDQHRAQTWHARIDHESKMLILVGCHIRSFTKMYVCMKRTILYVRVGLLGGHHRHHDHKRRRNLSYTARAPPPSQKEASARALPQTVDGIDTYGAEH